MPIAITDDVTKLRDEEACSGEPLILAHERLSASIEHFLNRVPLGRWGAT